MRFNNREQLVPLGGSQTHMQDRFSEISLIVWNEGLFRFLDCIPGSKLIKISP